MDEASWDWSSIVLVRVVPDKEMIQSTTYRWGHCPMLLVVFPRTGAAVSACLLPFNGAVAVLFSWSCIGHHKASCSTLPFFYLFLVGVGYLFCIYILLLLLQSRTILSGNYVHYILHSHFNLQHHAWSRLTNVYLWLSGNRTLHDRFNLASTDRLERSKATNSACAVLSYPIHPLLLLLQPLLPGSNSINVLQSDKGI